MLKMEASPVVVNRIYAIFIKDTVRFAFRIKIRETPLRKVVVKKSY